MDNQQTPKEQKPKTNIKKWLWIGGSLIILIIIIASVGGKSNENSNQTQTTVNQNTAETTAKTITIPSLVEYDDDQTADDTVQDIKQENVTIPAGYTIVSSGNANVSNPVGSEVIIASVVDGDTLKLSDGNKVRILGIDTPETVDPRKAVQCFGKEASAKMKELVNGQKVVLVVDANQGDKDKYGRLLRYIYKNGADIGAEMIKEGYAYAYLKYPVSRTDDYKNLETQAREGKKGLWAVNTCNGSTELPSAPTTQQNTNTTAPTNTATNLNTAPVVTNTNTAPTNTSVNTNQATNTDTTSSCSCDSNQYNCTNFKTHAEAQAVYDCCMKKVGTDIHGLDGNDNDGLACESLP